MEMKQEFINSLDPEDRHIFADNSLYEYCAQDIENTIRMVKLFKPKSLVERVIEFIRNLL